MEEYHTIRHTFEPVWDSDSKILILGTFPSVKSRENWFITAIRRTGSGSFWQAFMKKRCRKR